MERDDLLRRLRPARLFVDGAFAEAADLRRVDVRDPSRGVAVGTAAEASAADLSAALLGARRATSVWERTSPRDRARLLRRLGVLLLRDAELFAGLIALETGVPFARARVAQVAPALLALEGAAARAELEAGALRREEGGGEVSVRPVSPGVVLAAVADHAPWRRAVEAVAAAIAAGGAVVVVAGEGAAFAADRFGSLLEEAAVPRGAVQILHGAGDLVRPAIASRAADRLVLATDLATSRALATAAAEAGVPCRERRPLLGAQVVFADGADPKAVAQAVTASYAADAGRARAPGGVVLVERAAYDRLRPRLVEAAVHRRAGCPFDRRTELPPLASEAARARVQAAVGALLASGGRLAAGGEPLETADGGGFFYRATLIEGLPTDAPELPLPAEGPVARVVPFDDDDAARRVLARLAPETPVGLRTGDRNRAREFAEGLGPVAVSYAGYDDDDVRGSAPEADFGFCAARRTAWVPGEAR